MPAGRALLILGLLAAPAGAATRITTHPWRGLALSAAIAVGSVWTGLAGSYLIPTMPPSFAILAAATLTYLAAVTATRLHRTSRHGTTAAASTQPQHDPAATTPVRPTT